MASGAESASSNNEGDASSEEINGKKLRVHQVRAEDVDEPQASSPAPAPIKGGENEVVRLSHVRSIEVKLTTPQSPPPIMKTVRHSTRGKKSPATPAIMESEGSECAPMDIIDKSPYEPMLNAEKGVKLFSDMQKLLAESDNDEFSRSVNPQATKIFGPTNAWCLVKANGKISLVVSIRF